MRERLLLKLDLPSFGPLQVLLLDSGPVLRVRGSKRVLLESEAHAILDCGHVLAEYFLDCKEGGGDHAN